MAIELPVLDITGRDTGEKVYLSEEVFGIEPSAHAIYLDVKRYLAAHHRGTHSTRTRGEVQGSTKKIRPQKYTGQARAGQRTSPIFRGGGVVFGPKPRDYDVKLNKKVINLARRSALSARLRDGAIKVVGDFSFEEPKTKRAVEVLNNLGLNDRRRILVVVPSMDMNVYLSFRNIPYVEVRQAYQLNTYELIRAHHLLFTRKAILKVNEMLLPKAKSHATT